MTLRLAAAALCVVQALARKPWQLYMPTGESDANAGLPVYPTGPVHYLREQRFRGNVLTPFTVGAYVSWHLAPEVRVGLDSRYEVAYQPGVLEEVEAFYDGGSGWRAFLERYPTDVVLVRRAVPVAALLADAGGWRRVYRDDVYELFARPGLLLPAVDRTSRPLVAAFP